MWVPLLLDLRGHCHGPRAHMTETRLANSSAIFEVQWLEVGRIQTALGFCVLRIQRVVDRVGDNLFGRIRV